MDAIRLSICKDAQDPIEPFEAVLDSFVRTQHKQVDLHIIPWDNYKQEMTAMALYGHGVHVSQVGAPVVNDLVAMNSLRPFTRGEVGHLETPPLLPQWPGTGCWSRRKEVSMLCHGL